MKKFIIAVLTILLMASPALAIPVTLAWDAPTTNADGSPLDPVDLTYEIHHGAVSGSYTDIAPIANVTTYTLDVPEGWRCFAVKSVKSLTGPDGVTYEAKSDFSNEVCTMAMAKPNPPTLLEAIVAAVKRFIAWLFGGLRFG